MTCCYLCLFNFVFLGSVKQIVDILASEELPLSAGTEGSGSINSQLTPLMGIKCKKATTGYEGCLPWRRDKFDYQGTVSNL